MKYLAGRSAKNRKKNSTPKCLLPWAILTAGIFIRILNNSLEKSKVEATKIQTIQKRQK